MKLSKLQSIRADASLQQAFEMVIRQDSVGQRTGQVKFLTPYATKILRADGYKVSNNPGKDWPWTIQWS